MISDMEQRQRQFLNEIQPFIDMKADIISREPIKYTMNMKTGSLEPRWTPEVQEQLKRIDELIEWTRKQILGYTNEY